MASGKILRQLFKAGTSGDKDAFLSASQSIIDEERLKQHHLLANDLEKILFGSSSHNGADIARLMPNIPTDKERGLPLLDIKYSQRKLEELMLPRGGLEAVDELLEEHRRQDVLRSYGIKPSSRVLFYGPPGCGKTMTAEVIAYELDLPLAVVRLDALVSSFLGETAANLRKVFDYISTNNMVALFDEFDALGKERGDSGEHGELRRVVNAVLQMMDAYSGKSLIIAATNHEKILDTAIWRRFDDIIEFSKPSSEIIFKILTSKLRGVRRDFEIDRDDVLKLFADLSGADIERVVLRAVKRMILKNQEFLGIKDLIDAREKEVRR